MDGIVVAFFVPVVCFLVIVAPIWIIFHYKSKSNVVDGLTAIERAELEEMIKEGKDVIDETLGAARLANMVKQAPKMQLSTDPNAPTQ